MVSFTLHRQLKESIMRKIGATLLFAAASVLLCAGLYAQDQNAPKPPKMPTAKEMAVQRTDQMKKLLDLNEKQYKEVYDMNLKEAKKQISDMESREKQASSGSGQMGGGMPPQGGMGGPGMGQGGPGMGQGGPGMGQGGPGMGQGGPGMGGNISGATSQNGDRMGNGGPKMSKQDEEAIEKAKAKKEKQLRKILSDAQFQIWQKDEAERESKEFWNDQNDQMKKDPDSVGKK